MGNRQHLRVSNDILNDKNLKPNDIGVYLAIGKYMNSDKIAYPSQATIVKDTGLALQTVRSCIKHLEDRNAFEIKREGRKNIYKFSPEENFEMFDYEFLNKPDLTNSEKGFIAKMQPFMLKEGQNGVVKYTYDELQDKTGMSISTILRNNKLLEKKDYVTVEIDKKTYHLDKLGQFVICAIKNLNDRVTELENKQLSDKDIERIANKLLELQQNKAISL